MMNAIIWEPCDRQHIVHAFKVLAKDIFANGDITEEEMNTFSEKYLQFQWCITIHVCTLKCPND